jgi:hypothetical protein
MIVEPIFRDPIAATSLQVFQIAGDNLRLSSKRSKPIIYELARPQRSKDLAPGIVMVPRADRNASYFC